MPYDADKDPYGKGEPKQEDFGRTCRIENLENNSVDLDPYAKAVHVIVAGRLKVLPAGNADTKYVDITSAPVGYTTPFMVRRVHTDTTAGIITIDD